MGPDLFSADVSNFLEKALGIQLAEPRQPLSEEKLKEIARNAGLTEEDWENLCEQLKGHLAKGRNFLKFANYTDAITDLEHAAAIAPYRADVLVDCGKAHLGRWKETGARSTRDRAETLFRKSLEIDPDNADAAEQLSRLKLSKPVSRISRKMAVAAAVLLLAGGVSSWMGIPGLSGKSGGTGGDPQIEAPAANARTGRTVYPPATLPPPGLPGPLAFDRDLVAHWTFDGKSPREDLAAGQHALINSGRVEAVAGVDGRAMRFFYGEKSGMYTNPSAAFTVVDSVTVSAWVKPVTWKSSQIVWFGDRRVGRDPWQLTILDSGQVRFRSDRSVTSDPSFTMLPNEIIVKPGNVPHLNQHVWADSPGLLPLNEWSFVTGRIQKASSGQSIITVFVNGTPVSEVKTTETVDYQTNEMWVTLGAVHDGNAQNFNGTIDEVRVYRSALTDEEIREIYQSPRRNEPGTAAIPIP
ncbi:MAG TPA: sialidase domain-containing protein [Verrucomicrobiales bacterium]|nr:sialidase domain-containing protein [Verrucomicrobiales bacterium]